jgi:hypothetical protein
MISRILDEPVMITGEQLPIFLRYEGKYDPADPSDNLLKSNFLFLVSSASYFDALHRLTPSEAWLHIFRGPSACKSTKSIENGMHDRPSGLMKTFKMKTATVGSIDYADVMVRFTVELDFVVYLTAWA